MAGADQLLKPVVPLMREAGFKKRSGHIYTVDLSADVIGWVGLNSAKKSMAPDEVGVNPVIGVRHQTVERLVAELCRDRFHPYVPPTVSSPIGYLLPECRYTEWLIRAGEEEPAREMVGAIVRHGTNFMERRRDLGSLLEGLDRRPGLQFGDRQDYSRPVAWLLAGDAHRAREDIERSLVGLEPRSDPAAVRFRSFGAAFLRKLGDS